MRVGPWNKNRPAAFPGAAPFRRAAWRLQASAIVPRSLPSSPHFRSASACRRSPHPRMRPKIFDANGQVVAAPVVTTCRSRRPIRVRSLWIAPMRSTHRAGARVVSRTSAMETTRIVRWLPCCDRPEVMVARRAHVGSFSFVFATQRCARDACDLAASRAVRSTIPRVLRRSPRPCPFRPSLPNPHHTSSGGGGCDGCVSRDRPQR